MRLEKQVMKLDKSKRTLLGLLCLYLAIGLVAVVLFFVFGSKSSRNGEGNVKYTFFDDGATGDAVKIANVNVIGEKGALVEPEPEPAPVVEKTPVEEEAPVEEPEKHFYSFKVVTSIGRLHVRQEPDINAKIINYLPKGTEGYILKKGDEWSLVTNGEITGYSFNYYLDMTEISVDELPDYFPEEYK